MPDTLDSLIDVISSEKVIYDEMLSLANRKKTAIIVGDVAELDQVVHTEEMLLLHLGDLEKKRRQIAVSVAESHHMEADQLKLGSWPGIDPVRQSLVDNLQKDFRRTLDAVSKTNQINSRLLTIHLQYVQTMIDEATQSQQEKTYVADGSLHVRRRQAVNLIDEMM